MWQPSLLCLDFNHRKNGNENKETEETRKGREAMNTTVTIHIGDQSKVKKAHNRRMKSVADKEKHINPNGEHEAWIDRNLRDVCEETFGDSIREFNERQKKNPSRRKTIESYMQESSRVDVNKNGKMTRHNLEREMVLYVGDKDSPLPDSVRKEAMKRFVQELASNPNIIVTGAYWHNDEMYQLDGEWHKSSPHVHLDYMMISRENKRGMRVQSSEQGALKEMGYGTKKVNGKTVYQRDESIEFCQGKDKIEDGTVKACCPISFFTKDLRENFEGIVKQTCKDYGMDVDITHTAEDREWLSKEVYGQRKDKERHKEELESLEKTKADKQREMAFVEASSRRNMAILTAQSRKAQEELDKSQEKLSQLDEERERMEEARVQAEEVQKQAENARDSAVKEVQGLNSTLESKRAEIGALDGQIKAKAGELARISRAVEGQKKELHEVKEKVSRWKDLWQRMEKSLSPLKNVLSGLFGKPTRRGEELLSAIQDVERNERKNLLELREVEREENEEENEEEYERW